MSFHAPAEVVAMCDRFAALIEFPDWVMYGLADKTFDIFGPAVVAFDKALHGFFPEQMTAINGYFDATSHPISKNIPLLTPSYALFFLACYFVTLLALYPIGLLVGKMQLKFVSVLHNFFLYALSLYMTVGLVVTAIGSDFSLWNNPVGEGDNAWRLAKLSWLFYVSKIPEFGDTFIMMLKQNYRQVSFLHVYHHCTVPVIWFFVTRQGPGGDMYWSSFLNTSVHVVMYGYYFGTSVFTTGPIRRFLNGIKFFITYGQMTQFALNVVQAVYTLYIVQETRYVPHLIKIMLFYMISLLTLFGNFLVQNQGKKKGAKKDAKADAKADASLGVRKSQRAKRE